MAVSLCAIVTLVISLALMVYGFNLILRKPKSQTDLREISEQIKGFAFLIIAQLIFMVGMAICFNAELFGLGASLLGRSGGY